MSVRPEPREERPAGRRRLSAGRIALLALTVAIGAFALGFLFTSVFLFGGGAGDDVVTVPDLRGQTEAAAGRIADRIGLTVHVGASLVNPEVDEGLVLAQSPLPGEEVAPGSAVRISLSAGAARRTVPDVRGMNGAQAREHLARYGFDVVAEERTDDAPRGRILEITPAPGSPLELPATVRLVISSGPPLAPVPNVVGWTEAEARERLGDAGFQVGTVDFDIFSFEAPGVVVEQQPAAGGDAPLGSAVSLVVAGAPRGDL